MAKKIRKGEKVLRFINKAGERGRRFTDIQKFILKINHPNAVYDSSTSDRGYYCDALYGTCSQKGLLEQFCIKNDRGRWTCLEVPKGVIYGSRFSARVLK
jgi:hypothetical protein